MNWKYSSRMFVIGTSFFVFFTLVVSENMRSDVDAGDNDRGNRRSPIYSMNKQNLIQYFDSILGLPEETSGNPPRGNHNNKGQHSPPVAGRIPHYVENLYDVMASAAENNNDHYNNGGGGKKKRTTGRGRRSLAITTDGDQRSNNVIDEPVTIQAIERDRVVEDTTAGDPDDGYLLQFDLEQLWISKTELRMAELVLAVNYGRLLIGGSPDTSSYSVYAYATTTLPTETESGGSSSSSSRRTRLLIGRQSLSPLDIMLRNKFVKLNVTDSVVHKVLADGPHSIVFEIFVARGGGGGAADGGDLSRHEVEHLFHLTSRGANQPLLVLYSSTAASKIEDQQRDEEEGIQQTSSRRRRRRRRIRSTGGGGRATAAFGGCFRHGECCLREWWIDLIELFRDTWSILMPEGFYANYCAGQCRYPMYDARWNATGNAQLRAAYNGFWRHQTDRSISSNNRNTTTNIDDDDNYEPIPNAHCIADNPSPITVVYRVGERYIIRQIDGMAAHSCMCA